MKKASEDPSIEDHFVRSVKEMRKFIQDGELLIDQVKDEQLKYKLKKFFLG
jgi:hypothetical protein